MIKVEFKIDGEIKVEAWDVSGLSWKYVYDNIINAVKSDYPNATDIKIIEALDGVSC